MNRLSVNAHTKNDSVQGNETDTTEISTSRNCW